jgi:arabinofuranan 3-O-arabinosyltransferase
MALYGSMSGHGAAAKLARPLELICFALVVAYALFLAATFSRGLWVLGADGAPFSSDFVNLWAAGDLTLGGHAASAYDWPTHKLVEESIVGHPFDGYFGYYAWPYPPTFLFAAAAVALLPYASAYFVWIFGTFIAYVAAIRAIVGERMGYWLAAAFPSVLSNFLVGQNGFLTAGLIGGALALLERQPVAAGALLGLLTCKPHLGVLFPIALIAGGHWRALASASLTAAFLAAGSWLAFGGASWHAFFASLSDAPHTFLSDRWGEWSKFQTFFGVTRSFGASAALAWEVQIVVAVAAAAAVAVLWKSRVPYQIKAAALATATLLATPYLYMYDLVLLAVPLAFLFQLACERGFLTGEMVGMAVACLLILIYPLPFLKAPVGFAAILVTAALVARRVLAARTAPIKHS